LSCSSGCTGGCGQSCVGDGTVTGAANPPASGSFSWEIKVGLARYPKPATFTDMAQTAYEKDGNLPTFGEMYGRYFPASPFQQSQIPLKISQTRISAATFHPSCLFLQSEAVMTVLRKSDAGGEFIHQILTDDAFTLVNLLPPNDGSGFRVRVWKSNAASLADRDNEGFYITAGTGKFESVTALTDVTFKRETANDDNTLVYIQSETTGSGTRTITNKIFQTLGANDDNGTNGNGKPKQITSEIFNGSAATGTVLNREVLVYSDYGTKAWHYTITRDVWVAPVSPSEAVGFPVIGTTPVQTSHTVETYRDYSTPDFADGGEPGKRRLVTFVNSGQTTDYTYVPYDENDQENATKYGRLAGVTRPDGSWSVYTYGMSTAPVITEYSSWLDEEAGENEDARKVETTVSGNVFTVKTYTAGQLTAKSQTTLSPGSGTTDTLVTTLQWGGTGDGAELSDTNSLTTTTAFFSDDATANAGRVHGIDHPDGTATTYAYDTEAGHLVTTVRTGAGSRTSVTGGTEVETTHGLGNIPIAETTRDIGTAVVLERWITAGEICDPLGRPITRIYNGNTGVDYDTSTYSCCGLEEFRARDGSTTHYYRDPLKRVFQTTTQADSAEGCPVVTTNTSISGLTTSQTRTVGTSEPVFLGSTTRSLDGLTTTTVSPSRKSSADTDRLIIRTVTNHEEGTGDTVTESYNTGTDPDVGTGWTTTSKTTHYLDGRTKSVSGAAVTNTYHTYEPYSMTFGTVTRSGILATVSTPTSDTTAEVTMTYSDPLDRTVRTVSPAAGTTGYTYHATNATAGWRGKLASVTDADEVATTYQYNAKGERDTTIRSVPTGPTTTATQTTKTVTIVTDVTGYGDCLSSSTTVNDTFVSQSLTVIDTSDGFTSATRTPTGTTSTFTTRPDASGVATTTTTRQDGTRTVTTTSHGLTTEVAEQTSDTNHDTFSSTTYDYDDLLRLQYVTDLRTGEDGRITYSGFTESGAALITDHGGRVTTNTCDALGRVIQITLPDNTEEHPSVTYTSYDPSGRVKARWGSQTYPTFRIHNEHGQLTELRTYQEFPGSPTVEDEPTEGTENPATTTWNFYADTGLLHEKLDADGKGPAYTYTPAGRIETRTWARPKDPSNPTGPRVTTTYGYQYGFLTSVLYSNEPTTQSATPNLGYFYDYLGRVHTVTRGEVNHAIYTYDATTLQLTTERLQIDSLDKTLTRTYEPLTPLRPTGYALAGGGSATWSYDNTGRFGGVTDSTDIFTYGYEPDSASLIATVTGAFAFGDIQHQIKTTNTWEDARDVLSVKKNEVDNGLVSQFTYSVNELGQREGVATDGTAFGSADHGWEWFYDSLGQLTEAQSATNPAYDRAYSYDSIGNRVTSTADTAVTRYYADTETPPAPGATPLNQYARIDYANITPAFLPEYDFDGNMTTGATVVLGGPGLAATSYQWDAENRLIRLSRAGVTVDYEYDFLGRLTSRDDGTSVTQFLYDGWNRIAEYTGAGSSATFSKSYLWGLDMSGSLQGAGGVGGLLSMRNGIGAFRHFPTYDGNGNVSEYIRYNGSQAAHFEYDPFGNETVETGGSATFKFRFATKPQDYLVSGSNSSLTSKLYYYGYRWYDPVTGRWLGRDPIGENGGVNLYGFVGNDGVDRSDFLGTLFRPYLDMFKLRGEAVNAGGEYAINLAEKDYAKRVSDWEAARAKFEADKNEYNRTHTRKTTFNFNIGKPIKWEWCGRVCRVCVLEANAITFRFYFTNPGSSKGSNSCNLFFALAGNCNPGDQQVAAFHTHPDGDPIVSEEDKKAAANEGPEWIFYRHDGVLDSVPIPGREFPLPKNPVPRGIIDENGKLLPLPTKPSP
jgi:RHS repeat-associated protein